MTTYGTPVFDGIWDNIIGIVDYKPYIHLEGFEKVLGRKFRCWDCRHLEERSDCEFSKRYLLINDCPIFKLSDNTITEIRLKDKEIEDTKIDTHPRYKGLIL